MSLKSLLSLVIDDDRGDAEILARLLQEIPGFRFEFVHEPDPYPALAVLRDRDFDIVFLDYQLGAVTGLELAQLIRSSGDLRPIIMFTGRGDENTAMQLGQAGVDAYLTKSGLSPDSIQMAVTESLRRQQNRLKQAKGDLLQQARFVKLEEANRELQRQNRRDPLTGISNRKAWQAAASVEHERSVRRNHAYSVLMLDVDYFKRFNDSQGHQSGDDCLVQVARCLSQTTRAMDVAARYGGEEFIVLCPETNVDGAARLGERMRRAVWNLNIQHPTSPISERVTISCGVAAGPAEELDTVIERADASLYAAKAEGRNRVSVHDPASDQLPHRGLIEAHSRTARRDGRL